MVSYKLLNLILNNVNFAVHELMGLAGANKLSNEFVRDTILKRHELYDSNKIKGRFLANNSVNKARFCCVCNNSKTTHVNPFTNKVTCVNCCKFKNVSETDAKNTYRLISKDLERIDRYRMYCRIYRKTMTLYSKKDVIGLSLIKYGIRR